MTVVGSNQDVASATYSVAVRDLCEFTAKVGSLDLRFTPAPTALQGMLGHQMVAQRRGPEHESEVKLSGQYQELRIAGRADGYNPQRNELEEVKTYRGRLDAMAYNHRLLHWAQAKVYGALMCQSRELDEITLSVVYFDVNAQPETPETEVFSARDQLTRLAYFTVHRTRILPASASVIFLQESFGCFHRLERTSPLRRRPSLSSL